MNLNKDDLVLQVSTNQPGNTIPQSMRDLCEVIERLNVERVEFELADTVNGLRAGVLTSFTVIRPMPSGPDPEDRIRRTLRPVLELLGLPERPVEVAPYDGADNPLIGDVDLPRTAGDYGPFGVYNIPLGVGADPYNPEGEEMDYSEDVEELMP